MSFSDWKEVRLGDVIIFNPRESISKNQVAKKIAMEKLKPYTKFINNFELAEFKGGTKFKNGDTLLARITPCLENGKTSQVTILENNEVGFGSTEYIVLREKVSVTDKNFIYYLSISSKFRDIAIQSMVGSSGRQRVQQGVLENTDILIPPLPEQKAISKTLSSLDDKIELNNRINKTLEEMSQAIFKSWFVDFDPFQDGEFEESELGRIPKGWKVDNLDNIAEFLNGLAMQKYRPDTDAFLPVIKIKELNQEITDGNSDKASCDILKKYVINNGDVIFSWSGTLVVKIWTGGKGGLNQHLFKVSSQKYEKWFYYLWTCYHLEKFKAIAQDKATTMGHIKRGHLTESKVIIPTDGELQMMNLTMNPIISQMIQVKVQTQTLTTIRDTLLPKLMSGEVRVPIEEVS